MTMLVFTRAYHVAFTRIGRHCPKRMEFRGLRTTTPAAMGLFSIKSLPEPMASRPSLDTGWLKSVALTLANARWRVHACLR